MNIESLLETGWNDHEDQPREVADRMAASLDLVQAPEHVAPFVGLLVHVHAEHLGELHRGIEVLQSLRGLPAFDGSEGTAGPITRGIALLSYAAGMAAALDGLVGEDRARVLAGASSAFANQGQIAALQEALSLADSLAAGSPALGALAVGGNNLAVVLEGKEHRTDVETEGMLIAARAGLKYWKLAGTWLEEERAHYRLARSLMHAGRAEASLQSARDCVAVCEANGAPAFELFFGHAVLALAARAAGDKTLHESHRKSALAQLDQVPESERQWCDSDLKELLQTQ